MAEPVPIESAVSAGGTYFCTDCGTQLKVAIGAESLPPCPECRGASFETASGSDIAEPSAE
jgi:hypothetical protein